MLGKRGFDSHIPWLFNVPLFIGLGITAFYPFLVAVSLSFSNWFMAASPSPQWWTFSNYPALFTDERFIAAFGRTFYYALVVVSFQLAIGLGLALLLNYEVPGKNIYRVLLLLPMLIVPMAVALMWRTMYNRAFGIINYFIEILGFPPVIFLGSEKFALPSIMVVDIWEWSPFVMIILLAGLNSIPHQLLEAARIDGASRYRVFFYITLPLLRLHIGTAVILRSIASFKVFALIWGITRGGPNFATETLYPFIYRESFVYYKMGYACAAAVVFFLIVFGMNMVFVRTRKVRWQY